MWLNFWQEPSFGLPALIDKMSSNRELLTWWMTSHTFLILQRFDDTKWGYFTECPQSGIGVEQVDKLLTVSFAANAETGERITIAFYPEVREIYLGTTPIRRGTSVIDGSEEPPPEPT